jgi:hypothetical protein
MKRSICRIGPSVVLALLGLAGILGCSRSFVPAEVAGPDQAMEVLRAVLEDWKNGQTLAAMKLKVPSVHAVDDDWQAGLALQAFELHPGPEAGGSAARISATLQFAAPNGSVRRTARYLVTLQPTISVVRQDDDE